MSFIRNTTFTLSQANAEELKPGKLVYDALVPGRKFIAQSMEGLIQSNLWIAIPPRNGLVTFTIFSEWSTLEDLQAYANQPTIKALEQQLAAEGEALNVIIYENLG